VISVSKMCYQCVGDKKKFAFIAAMTQIRLRFYDDERNEEEILGSFIEAIVKKRTQTSIPATTKTTTTKSINFLSILEDFHTFLEVGEGIFHSIFPGHVAKGIWRFSENL